MQTKFQTNQKEQELLLQKSENQYQKKLLIGVSVGLFTMLILTFLLFYNYHAKKKAKELLEGLYFELNEQKEEITVQAEELREANEEILSMNNNLEKAVKERTQQIEKQNVQIIGYAFANAHRVRGPLARILGLVNLMRKGIEPSEIPQYVEMLDTSAQEMNEVVKEINEMLEEEAREKWSLTRLKKMLE
jgi:signal transduction histidine kinase